MEDWWQDEKDYGSIYVTIRGDYAGSLRIYAPFLSR